DTLGVTMKLTAGVSQNHLARFTTKERYAQRFLQRAHALANRGLTQMQGLACFRKTAPLGGLNKSFQVRELDRFASRIHVPSSGRTQPVQSAFNSHSSYRPFIIQGNLLPHKLG